MDKGTDEMRNRELKHSFVNYSDKNAAEIQREIRTTRADLDETVNELQARLSPQHYINQATDMVRDAMRHGAPRLAETLRANPLPTALAAVGLGWLFLRNARPVTPSYPTRRREYGVASSIPEADYELSPEGQFSSIEGTDWAASVHPMEEGKEWISGTKEKVKDKASQIGGQVKEKAGQWAGQAREKAGHLKEATREKASQFAGATREKAGELADATRHKAGELAHQAGRQMRYLGESTSHQLQRAGSGTSRMYRDNPLAFCALLVGIGAAIALGIPGTRQESELMGSASDELKRKAQEAGRETMDKIGQVVSAGGEAARQEAQQQDLI